MLAIDGFLSNEALELLYKFGLEVAPFNISNSASRNLNIQIRAQMQTISLTGSITSLSVHGLF